MAALLSVNLNKIALLRNSRLGNYPSLMSFTELCLKYGVTSITVHPRPDQRHIRANDIPLLKNLLAKEHKELNIEGNPFSIATPSLATEIEDYPGFLSLVSQYQPNQCTLVPDGPSQLTSDAGFNLVDETNRLKPIIQQLQRSNIRVSLFVDADIAQIEAAAALGADRVELFTGPFANGSDSNPALLGALYKAAERATELGLGVNAGHDLNLNNLAAIAKLPGLCEVSIGHALIVDSLILGMGEAIKRYQQCLAV